MAASHSRLKVAIATASIASMLAGWAYFGSNDRASDSGSVTVTSGTSTNSSSSSTSQARNQRTTRGS